MLGIHARHEDIAEPQQGVSLSCEDGFDIHHCGIRTRTTTLHELIDQINIPVLQRWIDHHDANVEVTNANEQTLLFPAVETGILSLVEFLLDRGANVHARDQDGNTPLHYAAQTKGGSNLVIQSLLNRGADIDAQNKDGTTPLMMAATKAGMYLVDNGANIHLRDLQGRTVLHYSTNRDALLKMLLLLDMNVEDVDDSGSTILHYAAHYGHSIRTLLDIGAHVNAVNKSGYTPIYLASSAYKTFTVRQLISHGASLREAVRGLLSHPSDGFRVLETAKALFIECARQGCVSGMRDIIQHEMWSLPSQKIGGEALITAVSNDHLYVVKFLIDHNVPIDHQQQVDRFTVLHIATTHKNEEMVKYLLDHHADRMMKDVLGRTPLDIAIERGYESIQTLLEYTPNATKAIHSHIRNRDTLNEYDQLDDYDSSTFNGTRTRRLLHRSRRNSFQLGNDHEDDDEREGDREQGQEQGQEQEQDNVTHR